MKPVIATLLSLVCASALVAQNQQPLPTGLDDHGLVPKAPLALVYARPYQVEKPMEFVINGKVEKVHKGYVLVLKADLRLCEPKDVPDFALFVDNALGQRVNSGYRDGHLIVITPELDLAKSLIWFGSRLLPDRTTAVVTERERSAALARGIAPFAREQIDAALKQGGSETLRAKDLNELWFDTKPLILKYAPAERPMAESLQKG
ncbi:MAG: hypothetical protein U1E76_00270 [Planctomycetota bacterium]